MFDSHVSWLRAAVGVINDVLSVNENIRDALYSPIPSEIEVTSGGVAPSTSAPGCSDELRRLLKTIPAKLDWQTYDHCAALTRLYAAYERFVNDLISSYVDLLPNLYQSYRDLPESVAINHRMGIGQILVKIGAKKQYRELEEAAVIGALYSGFRVGDQYTLIPQAFLLETSNYRFETLMKLFSGLALENCSSTVLHNPALKEFMRTTRGEAETVQSELDRFVEYRNEAAHGLPDNLLSADEIAKIGEFICELADALCDMVASEVQQRHLKLGHSVLVGTVVEVHHGARVAVVKMVPSYVRVGDEMFLSDSSGFRRTRVEELQLNDAAVSELAAEDGQELGIKMSVRAKIGYELRRLVLPDTAAPEQMAFTEFVLEDQEDATGSVPVESLQDEGCGPSGE